MDQHKTKEHDCVYKFILKYPTCDMDLNYTEPLMWHFTMDIADPEI